MKRILRMTWPIFFELSLQMLVGNIDKIMVGRYSQTAVAAIGNANQVMTVLLLLFSIINLASTILISQYRGANREDKLEEIYTLALFNNFIFSFLISFILYFFGRKIFEIINIPLEVLPEAILYVKIIGGFIFLQALFLTFSSIFRSNGWLRETFVVSVVMNLVNILGNGLLIYGLGPIPSLGLAGVAIATVFARAVGLAILILLFIMKSKKRPQWKLLYPFPWSLQKQMLRIGLPSAGESLSYSGAQMMILSFINQMGAVVVTISVYAKMFAMLSYLYTSAVAQAAQLMIGFLSGRRLENEIETTVIKTVKTTVGLSFLISLLLYFFSPYMFTFFKIDPQYLQLAQLIMLIDIPLEMGRAVNMVMVRSMQGCGDVVFPVYSGIACVWGLEVVLSYIFGIHLGFGLAGVWAAMAFDECFRAFIFLWRWKSGAWKNRVVIT